MKCIYIDPPYKTGEAFEDFDDNLEISQWLTMMRDRLILLKKLLRKDGIIFISINERISAYLKVLLDEIFSRKNYLGEFIWRNRKGGGNDSKYMAIDHETILVYARNEEEQDRWRVGYDEEYLKRYKHSDEEGKYYWDTLIRPGLKNPIIYTVTCPDGSELTLESQYSENKFYEDLKNKKIRFKKINGGWSVHRKVYQPEGRVVRSILYDLATYSDARKEMEFLFGYKKAFSYPKPGKLISFLLELGSEPGDLILDSFLGSGTTTAEAHKMGRRWIGIEIGGHAETLCIHRLKKMVEECEKNEISNSGNFRGNGFRYYIVGKSIISEREMNWNLTYEEIAKALFMMFNYLFIGKFHDEIYIGKRKEKYALSIASKDMEIIRAKELGDIVTKVKETYTDVAELEIYTNKGVGVKGEDLSEGLTVKKIPESVLSKYKL